MARDTAVVCTSKTKYQTQIVTPDQNLSSDSLDPEDPLHLLDNETTLASSPAGVGRSPRISVVLWLLGKLKGSGSVGQLGQQEHKWALPRSANSEYSHTRNYI